MESPKAATTCCEPSKTDDLRQSVDHTSQLLLHHRTNYTAGDFFYQKAWFIRLQNISLGYTLPKSLLAKTKVLSNVRFHASVNNLFVITPYKGLDPETDAYAAAYPNARTFSFGVDVSF